MTIFSVAIITTAFLSISFNSKQSKLEEPAVREISFESGPGGTCAGHGGPANSLSVIWNVATCKTDCKRKIGFRCGKVRIVKCADGASDVEIFPSTCPSSDKRSMEADLIFYDNNTVKLIFRNSMPEEELSNTTFEIEEGDEEVNDMKLPSDMLLDGLHYNILRVKPGEYQINYRDGEFGSVIINIELIR